MKMIDLHFIKQFADQIFHCGDYGHTYIKNDLSEVCVVLGDADDPDLDDFHEYVEEAGFIFRVEAERHPGNDYIVISHGIEAEIDEDGDILEEPIPIFLSVGEYVEYLQILKRLEE